VTETMTENIEKINIAFFKLIDLYKKI